MMERNEREDNIPWIQKWYIVIPAVGGTCLFFILLWKMIGRVELSSINLAFLNNDRGGIDPGSALQFISNQIDTFQLYIVLFTLIAGIVAFMGYNTMKDAIVAKLKGRVIEEAKKVAEDVARKEWKNITKEKIGPIIEDIVKKVIENRQIEKPAENPNSQNE